MKYLKLYLLVLLFFLFYNNIYSQLIGPPSLAAGAGSVTLQKGVLDSELIGAIIASKQDEIKKEIAQRLILRKLEGGAYTHYQFAERLIQLLFNEREPKVIKNELLQYGAEYMITLGILEFYAANHFNDGSNSETKFYAKELHKLIKKFDFHYYKKSRFFKKSDLDNSGIIGQYFEKPLHLFHLKDYLFTLEKDTVNLSEVLIDMTFEVCRNNKFLQLSGFFQKEINHLENNTLNKYLLIKSKLEKGLVTGLWMNPQQPTQLGLSTTPASANEVLKQLEVLKNKMATDLNLIFRFSYLLSQLNERDLNDPLDFFNQLHMKPELRQNINDLLEISNLDNHRDQSFVLEENHELLKKIKEDYQTQIKERFDLFSEKLKTNISVVDVNDKSNALAEAHYKKTLLQLYPLASMSYEAILASEDKFYYSLNEELLPQLTSLNAVTQAAFKEPLDSLRHLAQMVRNQLQLELYVTQSQDSSSILYDLDKIKSTYVKLLDVLNNLDKVESYDYIFKFLVNMGSLNENQAASKILNSLTNATEKYLLLDKKENKLDIDVESMLVDLFKEYGENSKSMISAYFSVGYNYAIPKDYIKINDKKEYKGLTFASEKIGIKISIINWAKERSYWKFNKDFEDMNRNRQRRVQRKPLVTDFHGIVFGSGLLYNIDALNSEDDFNSPMVGGGLGFTFFNGLDLNFNYALLTERPAKEGLFNVSFDIKITEYLAELGKKRKANQSNKD